jgi:cysteine synthase B
MGTTGTIMGTSRYLKEQSESVQIVGVTPAEGSQIPGIRRWPKEYLPTIFDETRVDSTIEVTQKEAEETGFEPSVILWSCDPFVCAAGSMMIDS